MYYFDMTPLPIIILIVVILVILARCIRVVQQSKAYVIERLGAFHAVWSVGLHFKLPFIDRIQRVVSLKEQVADFPPQPVITKDNVTMQIDTVLYFQITDPKLYAYGVENPMNAIENLTATTLRNIIGELELDQSLTSRDVINARMRSILDEATDPWGIKVNRVELKNILPPKDIQNAMEKQMRAERERRESILQAEGQKQSQILVAEGEKESRILRADAEKQARIMEAEAELFEDVERSLPHRCCHPHQGPGGIPGRCRWQGHQDHHPFGDPGLGWSSRGHRRDGQAHGTRKQDTDAPCVAQELRCTKYRACPAAGAVFLPS